MNLNKNQVMALLILIFISVQILGLLTGFKYLQLISLGEAEPALGQPNNPMNSLYLLLYLVAITGLLLIIIKFKRKMLTVLEGLAIFFASDIVFELLIPIGFPVPGIGIVPIGPFLALALTYFHLRKPTYLSQNLALIFAVSGAGAVLGSSLGIIPVLVFMIALGIYDFISVFYTKHMVYMAKAITERPRAFTAALPSGVEVRKRTNIETGEQEANGVHTDSEDGHTFQLGGGDLAIPLMLSVSTLRIGIPNAIFTSIGSLIALVLLFKFILKKPGMALPALPPVSAGGILGFLASLLVF